jgi:hypothetical protein
LSQVNTKESLALRKRKKSQTTLYKRKPSQRNMMSPELNTLHKSAEPIDKAQIAKTAVRAPFG